ncbi:type II toxin-antitoxin system Phd/YefM family antitoxin [Terriglobus sp.]|uniref:type II toxin-antitoxin system Phd/YefM family antitoxin n=1 Tax=Terriglobus sp. TaxID=1889013 RepID=UPI003AFFD2C3
MTEIDIETAKQQIGPLLDRVAGGEQVTITAHGRAVARVLPTGTLPAPVDRTPEQQQRIIDAMADIDRLRASLTPGDYSWEEMKKLRDFGRPGCE